MNTKRTQGGLTVALSFLFLGIGGCGSGGAPLDPLSEAGKLAMARTRWAESGTRSYQFTLFRSAFTAPGYNGPARVTVTNGVVTKVEAASDTEIIAGAFDSCDTIEELFGKAQQGIETSGGSVVGSYDEATGVPRTISIDPIPQAADDEVAYIVTEFQAL